MNYTLNPRRKSYTFDFLQKCAVFFSVASRKKSALSKEVTGGSYKRSQLLRVQVS